MTRRIYLDYNATAPLRSEAAEAMRACQARGFGNASTPYQEGRAARHALQEARQQLAIVLGAERDEILFTSGGTEANHLGLLAALLAARRQRKAHVVTSAIEHASLLKMLTDSPLRELWSLDVAPVDHQAVTPVDGVLDRVRSDTALVVLQLVNNEVGTIQPVAALASALAARGIPLLCDAVQALGKLDVDVRALGVSLLTLSAHKVGGPPGIGALYVRSGTPIAAPLVGGSQELGLRPGTEPVALAVGFARAAQLASDDRQAEQARLEQLRALLCEELRAVGCVITAGTAVCVANTLHLVFPGLDAMALVAALDLQGIAISTGAACSTGANLPSPVLNAIGSGAHARSAIRISMGRGTSADDVLSCARTLARTVRELRLHAPRESRS
ncbi:MAG: cysteine desulfurase family protein [Planctomycetota bacterium]